MDFVHARPDEAQGPEQRAVETFMARMPQHVLDRVAELTDQAVDMVDAIRSIAHEYERISWAVEVLAEDLHDYTGDASHPFYEACGLYRLWTVVAAIAGPLEENWHGVSDSVVEKGNRVVREERPLRRAG